MKRAVFVMGAVLLLASVAGCGKSEQKDATAGVTTTAATDTTAATATTVAETTTEATETTLTDATTEPEEHVTTEAPSGDDPTPTVPDYGAAQWASGASATTSYGDEVGSSWNSSQAIGKPDVPACADDGKAWASLSASTVDTLTATFAKPVRPRSIVVVETYTVGQVSKVVAKGDGRSVTVYTATPAGPQPEGKCPAALRIDVSDKVDFAVDSVAVTVDQTKAQEWNEIDAIGLVG